MSWEGRGRWGVALLLGLLALTELLVRLKFDVDSVTRAGLTGSSVRITANETVVRTETGEVGTQFFVLLCVLYLSSTVPLGFGRASTAAVALCGADVLALVVFRTLPLAALAAALLAGYRLGRSGSRVLVGLLGLPFVLLALAGPARPAQPELRVFTILLAALVPVAAIAGISRRAHRESLENTAAQQAIAGRLLEHTARGERARISRELHDVVAHHVSMIAVQAETARLTVPGMPAEGAKQLLGIGNTARAALTEMRRLLGVLRADAQTQAADRQPQPGLQELNELLDEARNTASANIRLIVSGRPGGLDPGVELAAYRIVQESLTNARRHAAGAAVDVEMHYTDDALNLRIRDNGPGSPAAEPRAGNGLLGMRERVSAVGGEISIGAATGGGFLITVSLPTKVSETNG
ncbi:MAG TPA: sensor histidine kinase [Kineosporiaceae bacterium]|nr:sensor histidine kinase [Kineosporiaceae bacterium]